MRRQTRLATVLLSVSVLLAGHSTAGATDRDPPPAATAEPWMEVRRDELPAIPREFRGAWVASVANIDWPSRPGLSSEEQQHELLAILDRAVALRLNAVILQVRPAADALYPSPHEPWSEYLTGTQGKAPEPYYDPLAFAVREAHRRGLELHAWFNPFRARHSSAKSPASPQHVSRTHPGLVKKYGGFLWMDPGEPEVREQALRVVLDVVRRYDVDGVHIDDYFYPYRERAPGGGYLQFPDDASWERYRRSGGRLARDDWRRSNVDRFVERLYGEVKREKPWVKVGISPFGIWRPGHPASVRGLDAYSELYADARKWVREGWRDYVSPQLYWHTTAPQQSYTQLLSWWVEQNQHGRHVWPGNFTSRVGDRNLPNWTPSELLKQVRLTRDERGASGNIHFSMKALLEDFGSIVDPLRRQAYVQPALVPASPWLGRGFEAPRVTPTLVTPAGGARGGLMLRLSSPDRDRVRTWVIRAQYGSRWDVRLVPAIQDSYFVEGEDGGRRLPDRVVVSAVDRVGREGVAVGVRPGVATGD
ncbi:MAG TPA: family 10 glycosylhydrolase [Gemmatimonadaceae bacterium]|nr:family 10 glycosylhydrolase [Gemmatimonadaceae bacterium]